MPPLRLPVIQNWSCHSCGGCCTQHQIEITAEEKDRLVAQGWTAADGVTIDPIVAQKSWGGPTRYFLAHQANDACAFLTEEGRCRIHAKFGEPAKPLACRVYPYVLHPVGSAVAVGLRFSCPSVVANQGRPVADQKRELQTIADLVGATPSTSAQVLITRRDHVAWSEWERCVAAVVRLLDDPAAPLLVRVMRTLAWADLVGQARLSRLDKRQLREFLQLIEGPIVSQLTSVPEAMDEPGAIGQLYFRLFVVQFARKDTARSVRQGLLGRLQLVQAFLGFARGRGQTVPLQPGLRAVPFAELNQPWGAIPEGTDALFGRYWRVKLETAHTFGPAFYGYNFVEGLVPLLLMLPVTLWLARWVARSHEHTVLQLSDVERGLAIADHHFGFSPWLGSRTVRQQLRYLATTGELARITAWMMR